MVDEHFSKPAKDHRVGVQGPMDHATGMGEGQGIANLQKDRQQPMEGGLRRLAIG
jgi:hypothetical protein